MTDHLVITTSVLPPPYDILYEDEHLIAFNKPAGIVVHPTYKHPDGTLTDAVFEWHEAIGLSRPWLLHRLDKETTGVTLFARSESARWSLARQFAQRMTHKRYLALALWPDDAPSTGEIDAPLWRDPIDRRRVIITPEPQGQPSCTRYRALAWVEHAESMVDGSTARVALVMAEPVTGRTHQIRAHLTSMGAPLIGDVMYLPENSEAVALAPRVMLHALRLDVRHPETNATVSVIAPPPDDFATIAKRLHLEAALDGALAEATTTPPLA